MEKPSPIAIDDAILVALRSPCAKSRRGAALFRVGGFDVIASNNAPPTGFACQKPCGPNACREICVHAEQAVILDVLPIVGRDLGAFDLVHVKIDATGKLVAGSGPSCPECSKLIVRVNVAHVWLYEAISGSIAYAAAGAWVRYTAHEFHETTLHNCKLV